MLNLVKSLKTNIKVKFDKPYTIDNFAFKCHYRFTMYLLLILTVLVTSQELIGEHIKCIADKGVAEKVINTFCFFTSTFTVIKYLDKDMVKEHHVPHPGVGAMGINSEEPIKRHAYYQWVPFVLFLQALTFYVPHFIWKRNEGGRMKKVVQGLEDAAYATDEPLKTVKIPTKAETDAKFDKLIKAFRNQRIINREWTLWLIACEFLNLSNLVFQIILTNVFLNGDFTSLGPKALFAGLDSEVEILDKVFPKMTKCTFHKFGPSGTIQSHDAMCVMALNIINEKIFIILWVWYTILLIISISALLWRLVTAVFYSRSAWFNRVAFTEYRKKTTNPHRIVKLLNKSSYIDWLFLNYMSENMDTVVFQRFLAAVIEHLNVKTYLEEPSEFLYAEIIKK